MAIPAPALPLISVVVPSYNQAPFLAEALDSIFRQAYPRLEVVVMDGGSTDDSVAILESYVPRLKYWQSQRDGGQSAAINAGVARCQGDLVAWLNSDDFYWGDALWTVARAYRAYPNHGLYVGNGFRHDQRTGRRVPFVDRHIAFNRAALRQGLDYVLQPATFILRQAWEAVGGIDPRLYFSMDWDLFLRIAERYPVVSINETLAVSREYAETKTSSGKLRRADEILRMVQTHTSQEVTPGSLIYLLGTLQKAVPDPCYFHVRRHLGDAIGVLYRRFSRAFGRGHLWSPERSDPQDQTYVSVATPGDPLAPAEEDLPPIGVIVPCPGRHADLDATLHSLFGQQYSGLEVLAPAAACCQDATGAEPPAGSMRVRALQNDPRRGPAGTINAGLAQASGEVLGWIAPGDRLTAGALREVGRAFAADPELDLVYANAAYVDEHGQPCLADQGGYRTGFCWGSFGPAKDGDREHAFAWAVPPSTVFFRRRLLEKVGPLDESFRLICDYDFFVRCMGVGRVRKIERTQALCRLGGPDDAWQWNARLVELYEYNRRRWPAPWARGFLGCLAAFVKGFVRRKLAGQKRRLVTRAQAVLVGLAAVSRLFNPERWWAEGLRVPLPVPPLQVPPPRFRLRQFTRPGGAPDTAESLRASA